MDRIEKLVGLESYKAALERTRNHEKHRIFCKHDMAHFLDVARICYILALEGNLLGGLLIKETIYGAAMIHDIGRFEQYEGGRKHDRASIDIGKNMLREAGFNEEEVAMMLEMAANHRNDEVKDENSARGIFYRADKLSRSCYTCEAEPQCDWKKEKKNKRIEY